MRSYRSARVPAITGALALTAAVAAPTADAAVTAKFTDTHLGYGERVVVRGAAQPGSTLALEYRAAGMQAWSAVARTTADHRGRYRLAVALSRSGGLRVATVPPTTGTPGTAFAAAAGPASVTAARRVRVAARLRASSTRLNVSAGRRARVAGTLRRPHAGRTVALQARLGGRWQTIDRDRTDSHGRFVVASALRRSAAVRLRFGGDALNAGARTHLGRARVFRAASASWYGPGFYGSRTACGQTFHAGIMGVAHKTLPCGTKLTFRAGSRLVHARVVDRGPFVAGRDFDLSPAVKAALGFGSTGTVWVAT